MTSEESKKPKDSKESSGIDTPFVVKSHDVKADSGYVKWLGELKERYHKSQVRAAIKVNSEQLLFNWQLGRDLVESRNDQNCTRLVQKCHSLHFLVLYRGVTM